MTGTDFAFCIEHGDIPAILSCAQHGQWPMLSGIQFKQRFGDITRMDRKRNVDWMCIGIEKIAETDADAEYAFVSNVYEPDPRFRHGSKVVGQNRGVLRVTKATGEITLVEAMPEDTDDKRFKRAARKIRQHWEAREFPDRTMFACG